MLRSDLVQLWQERRIREHQLERPCRFADVPLALLGGKDERRAVGAVRLLVQQRAAQQLLPYEAHHATLSVWQLPRLAPQQVDLRTLIGAKLFELVALLLLGQIQMVQPALSL